MLGWGLAYLAVLVAVGLLARHVLGDFSVPRYLRHLAMRLLVALVVLLPLIVVPAWFMATQVTLDPSLKAGALAGTVIATGWIVTFIFAEYRDVRGVRDKRRDTLLALRSEVFALVDKLDNSDLSQGAQDTQSRILTPDPTDIDAQGNAYYHPYATSESDPLVFKALATSVPLLDEETVEATVRFYAEYTDMQALVADMRAPDTSALPATRRAALHEQLTRRRRGALLWGLRAYVQINTELGIDKPGDVPRSDKNLDIQP